MEQFVVGWYATRRKKRERITCTCVTEQNTQIHVRWSNVVSVASCFLYQNGQSMLMTTVCGTCGIANLVRTPLRPPLSFRRSLSMTAK